MNVVPLTPSIPSSRDVSKDEILSGFTRLFSDLAIQTSRIDAIGSCTSDVVLIKAAIVASATHLLNANAVFVKHLADASAKDGA